MIIQNILNAIKEFGTDCYALLKDASPPVSFSISSLSHRGEGNQPNNLEPCLGGEIHGLDITNPISATGKSISRPVLTGGGSQHVGWAEDGVCSSLTG